MYSVKKIFCFAGIVLIAQNCFAQSVYSFDITKDIITGSIGLGLSIPALFIERAASHASPDTVLYKDRINGFDRALTFNYNKPLSIASDIAVCGLVLTPLLSLTGNARDAGAWLTYGIMYAEASLFIFGTTEILKKSIARYRPYNYFGNIPLGQDDDYYMSFPSRHTAFAFMSASFLTATFWAEYPDSVWKIPVTAAAYAWAAGVGASRIFSGYHFFSDVLTGAAIGSLCGYLIPRLHLSKKPEYVTLTVSPYAFAVNCRF